MNGFYSLIYSSSWGCLTRTPHVRINIILKLNLVALKKCYLNNKPWLLKLALTEQHCCDDVVSGPVQLKHGETINVDIVSLGGGH